MKKTYIKPLATIYIIDAESPLMNLSNEVDKSTLSGEGLPNGYLDDVHGPAISGDFDNKPAEGSGVWDEWD